MFHDILDERGNFLERQTLSNKFETAIGFLEYSGLIAAIPQNWKRVVKNMTIPEQAISSQEQPFLNCSKRLLALSILLNRDIYWELVSRKMTRPVCALKWCTRYKIEVDVWKTIYKQYANIKDTKLKAFQFKVLNNLLPCNLYLARIGKCKTIKCSQCDEIEDITHYLANCPVTRNIWDQLSLWWKNLSGQKIDI